MIAATVPSRRRPRPAVARARSADRQNRGDRHEPAWGAAHRTGRPRSTDLAPARRSDRIRAGARCQAASVSTSSDLALLSSIGTQLDDIGARITEMAERYGATPDSALRERALRRRAWRVRGPAFPRASPRPSSAHARLMNYNLRPFTTGCRRATVRAPDLRRALAELAGRRADAGEPARIAARLARVAHLATVLDETQREHAPLLRRHHRAEVGLDLHRVDLRR